MSTVFALSLSVSGLSAPAPAATPPAPNQRKLGQKNNGKTIDPVCGMEVETKTALSTSYKGKTYYFCSPEDRAKFLKSPDSWVGKKK
ncbi:MAG: YHS domain-containing protein [Acidobacteriota bacterium]|nr:YHS domain-containing protein [Acidobacteriota bacterium]